MNTEAAYNPASPYFCMSMNEYLDMSMHKGFYLALQCLLDLHASF